MVRPSITLAAVLLTTACSSMPIRQSDLVTAAQRQDYVPVEPQQSDQITFRDPSSGASVTKAWAQLTRTQIATLLPNQSGTISTSRVDASGSIKYLTGNVSQDGGSYRVVFDYAKFTTIGLTDDVTKKDIGSGRVGVGLRIKADIVTNHTNLDLGSLIAIGVAAKLGYVHGSLEVQTIGLSSAEITSLFPTPSTIDETSIQKALEAIAAIKAKIEDAATSLSPQLLAWRLLDDGSLKSSLAKTLK